MFSADTYATYPFEDDTRTKKEGKLPKYGVFHESGPTAVQAMKQKFGEFIGAERVVVAPQTEESRTGGIVGVEKMTLDDLRVVRRAVDEELLRLANLRSDSQQKREKASALQTIRTYLVGFIERVERGALKTDQIPIFPATARVFLKVFRSTDLVPELIDPSGNTPVKVRKAAAPTVASVEPLPPLLEEVKDGLFAVIQDLRWRLAADYQVEQNSHRRMLERLIEMERRVMNYTLLDEPMPEGYQKMFLEEIEGMRDVLKGNLARMG